MTTEAEETSENRFEIWIGLQTNINIIDSLNILRTYKARFRAFFILNDRYPG